MNKKDRKILEKFGKDYLEYIDRKIDWMETNISELLIAKFKFEEKFRNLKRELK